MHRAEWEDSALDDLERLPKKDADAIFQKVERYLVQNPRQLGEALTGNLSGLHRYRIREYRVIYRITEERLIITVIRIGHRKEVYG